MRVHAPHRSSTGSRELWVASMLKCAGRAKPPHQLCEGKIALSPAEAAQLLGCDEETIRRWCRRRHLRHSKIGRMIRIEPSALEEFIENAEISSEKPRARTH